MWHRKVVHIFLPGKFSFFLAYVFFATSRSFHDVIATIISVHVMTGVGGGERDVREGGGREERGVVRVHAKREGGRLKQNEQLQPTAPRCNKSVLCRTRSCVTVRPLQRCATRVP